MSSFQVQADPVEGDGGRVPQDGRGGDHGALCAQGDCDIAEDRGQGGRQPPRPRGAAGEAVCGQADARLAFQVWARDQAEAQHQHRGDKLRLERQQGQRSRKLHVCLFIQV